MPMIDKLTTFIPEDFCIPYKPRQATRTGSRTLPITGYKQTKTYTCGFASALIAVHYFHPALSRRSLIRMLGTNQNGTHETAMIRTLGAYRLRVGKIRDISFPSIQKAIDNNKLLIAPVKANHYVVIYGYDTRPRHVYMADPLPFSRCQYRWADFKSKIIRYDNTLSVSKK
jgi:ABC-type bacteriocin/lantibiotic exporter with double-glycine peptidase domain